jgi:MFS family permease
MRPTSAAQSRSPLQLLRDRTFGPFVVGKILSSCGNWIQQIAAAVLMFELTRSALWVGSVSVLLFAGPLVLALWTGALTDRRDRRLLLMLGRGVSAAAVGALALLLLVHGTDGFGGPVVLLIGAAMMGVGHALSLPAMQALTPGLVPDEDLEQALAFASVAPSIARTVGPALGAGLLLLGGPGLALAVAAGSHVLFIVVLAVIRARPQRREAGRPGLLGGVRYVLHDRTITLLLAAIALLGFGADPVITLAPSLADDLGGGSELVGLFASAFGVGAVVAVLVFRRLRRLLSLRRVGAAGYLIVATGLAAVALVDSATGAAAGFLVAGGGFMLATVALNTRIQRRVPDELRGRVMALWGVAFLGSRPVAAPVNGAIADLTSVDLALLVAASIVLAAALLARVQFAVAGVATPRRRRPPPASR